MHMDTLLYPKVTMRHNHIYHIIYQTSFLSDTLSDFCLTLQGIYSSEFQNYVKHNVKNVHLKQQNILYIISKFWNCSIVSIILKFWSVSWISYGTFSNIKMYSTISRQITRSFLYFSVLIADVKRAKMTGFNSIDTLKMMRARENIRKLLKSQNTGRRRRLSDN